MTRLIPLLLCMTIAATIVPAEVDTTPLGGDRITSFSVRDQPIDQVLLAFAEQSGLSIVTDGSVTGTISLVLHEMDAPAVLNEIAAAGGLFLDDRDGVYWLSRVRIRRDRLGWELFARDTSIHHVAAALARRCGTGLFVEGTAETGPATRINLSVRGANPEELVNAVAAAVGYTVRRRSKSYFLHPESFEPQEIVYTDPQISVDSDTHDETTFGITVERNTPIYSVVETVARARDLTILATTPLLGTCGPFSIDPLIWPEFVAHIQTLLGVSFNQDGSLLLVQTLDDVDRLAAFRQRAIICTEGLPAAEIERLLATVPEITVDWGDRNGGRVLISGMPRGIATARSLIASVVDEGPSFELVRYRCLHTSVQSVADGISSIFPSVEIRIDARRNTLIAEVQPWRATAFQDSLSQLDAPENRLTYRCRYSDSETLVQAAKERFPTYTGQIAGDGETILFHGPKELNEALRAFLLEFDRPTDQIRFDLCILQYQRGDNRQHGLTASIDRDESSMTLFDIPLTIAAAYDRLTSIQFDFLSALGYRAALSISEELTNNTARLVVDTSLRVKEGEQARLENATTYRYRDVLGDDNTEGYRAITREIDSGLTVDLQGVVQGDRTIRVTIEVGLSKNGTDMSGNGNPPPTSRKLIETSVVLKAGEPVVVGGLLQREESVAEHRFPILGRIPLLRYLVNGSTRREEETEFVLYLTAFADPVGSQTLRATDQLSVLHRIGEER